MRNANTILVGKPKGKRPLGRLGRGWEDNVKINIMEIMLEGMDWIHLALNRDRWRAVVNRTMNFLVP
jgi:hypothetical protein